MTTARTGSCPYIGRYGERSPPACWWAKAQVDPWRTASPCQPHRRRTDPHSSHCLENSHSSAWALEFETSPLIYGTDPPASKTDVLTWQLAAVFAHWQLYLLTICVIIFWKTSTTLYTVDKVNHLLLHMWKCKYFVIPGQDTGSSGTAGPAAGRGAAAAQNAAHALWEARRTHSYPYSLVPSFSS